MALKIEEILKPKAPYLISISRIHSPGVLYHIKIPYGTCPLLLPENETSYVSILLLYTIKTPKPNNSCENGGNFERSTFKK